MRRGQSATSPIDGPAVERMPGRPILLDEAQNLDRNGLMIVLCHRHRRENSRPGGCAAGVKHTESGWQLHVATPVGHTVYPCARRSAQPGQEYDKQQVAPVCEVGGRAGHRPVGVYPDSRTLEWALRDGPGSCFRQHDWDSPGKPAHPAAHPHHIEPDTRRVAGFGVAFNHFLKPRYGPRTDGLRVTGAKPY